MSRFNKLPKDILVKLLEEVENRDSLTLEQLKQRVERDTEEIRNRENKELAKKTKEKNVQIKNILRQLIDIFPILKGKREEYLDIVNNGNWEFILEGRSCYLLSIIGGSENKFVKVYLKEEIFNGDYYTSIPIPYLEFFSELETITFNDDNLIDQIEHYIEGYDGISNIYNIFYTNGQLSSKECKHCGNIAFSNFGTKKGHIFYYSKYYTGDKDLELYDTPLINDNNICVKCLPYL